MAIRAVVTTQRTSHLTLRFHGNSTELTRASRARLDALLRDDQLAVLREVSIVAFRADVDGRHPSNNLTNRRADAIARELLDSGVSGGLTVTRERAHRLHGPRPGQVKVSFTFLD